MMIAGHLQEKKGYFYVVLNYKDTNDKRRTKWIPTGYPAEERNRSKAQTFLKKQQKTFVIPAEEEATAEKEQEEDSLDSPEILFADYLANWLQIARSTIAITTYSSYSSLIKSAIDPWFRKKGVTLKELNARNIQEFYTVMLTRVKPNTVIHYHAIIHRALKYAVRTDLIAINPADKVDRPRKNGFMASFYSKEEMNRLFDACEGTLIEVPVKMAAFYGLRRSEVMGLKWDAIDFEKDTVSIQHTVTCCMIDGKSTIVASDSTKSKSSRRTLPLVGPMRELLLKAQREQTENRRLCGNCYCKDYEGYICINEMGERFNPSVFSTQFRKLLEKNDLRHIRFHDLRHSCASLLLANNVSMKQIQEWLGHSDFSTTANIYAHMDPRAKISSAEAMVRGLGLEDSDEKD